VAAFYSGVIAASPEEALVSRLPIYGSAILMFGLVIAAGCLAPAPARAYPYRVSFDCTAGMGMCVQACSVNVPGGLSLGKCNNFCSQKAGICEASRIPLPAHQRTVSRYAVGRK
jgi:hypothetical protein